MDSFENLSQYIVIIVWIVLTILAMGLMRISGIVTRRLALLEMGSTDHINESRFITEVEDLGSIGTPLDILIVWIP